MSTDKLCVTGGILHVPVCVDDVETGRFLDFNPSDQGFAEDLYGLVNKISAIHEEKKKMYELAADPAAKFDISRDEDRQMRSAVDSLFGNGFCEDVFKTRLFAIADGMTVIENFLFGVLDMMDESVTENISKRDAKIRKYTEKYRKYRK